MQRGRNRSRLIDRDQFVAGVVVAAVMASLLGWVIYRYVRNDLARSAERERLVHAVETFHDRNGRYPDSLAEAGVAANPTIFPHSSYSKSLDGKEFALSVELGWCLGITYWQYDYENKRWEEHLDD